MGMKKKILQKYELVLTYTKRIKKKKIHMKIRTTIKTYYW